jgi:hypothetical protein
MFSPLWLFRKSRPAEIAEWAPAVWGMGSVPDRGLDREKGLDSGTGLDLGLDQVSDP